jgi:hypothetical protein
MKNSKHSIWTLESKRLKSSKSKLRLGSMRQVCASKNGFDAALLQLGISVTSPKEKLETQTH